MAPAISELVFETTLASGHRLSLRRGDITDEVVDSIVNAANTGLCHGGGVAGAILRKGGQSIQDESDRIGKVATGSAAATGAGKLKARMVIHAVGPVWRGNTPDENDRLLASATIAALDIARARGMISIAFPAISSGIFGFPKIRCAEVMVDAVMGWASANSEAGPRDLRFVIIDAPTVEIFDTELTRRFAANSE